MVSIFDIILIEFLEGATNPLMIMGAIIQLLEVVVVLGVIFSVIFKKYSFLGYPLKDWPGWGILAAVVFVLIEILMIIRGNEPLSFVGSIAVAMILLVLANKIFKLLKRQKNSA
jgi:hypothetical protein